MRKFLWLLWFLGTVPVAAQGVLPENFSGWKAVPGTHSTSNSPENLSRDQAAILRACGSESVERQSYQRGTATLSVAVVRMSDPTAAYSAYSFLRPANAIAAKPIEHSTVSQQEDLLLVRNFLIDVTGQDLIPATQDLKALAAQVAPYGNQAPYPTLSQHLPQRDFVPRSDRYVPSAEMLNRLLPTQAGAGDWLGFSDGVEAEAASYQTGGQQVTLLIASYPTQQLAAKRMDQLQRLLDLNSPASGSSRPALFGRRFSSLIALVYGANSSTLADSLLNQISYKTDVTWTEPTFHLTQPNITVILRGIFVGTGLILIFAMVAGIAFGGVRIVVKHFLPGVVFDRGPSVEILQLGLNSKPIEAKDFY